MRSWRTLCLVALLLSGCQRKPEEETTIKGKSYLIVRAVPSQIAMVWKRADGSRYRTLDHALRETGAHLAVNAGIYDKTYTPVGLYVESGRVRVPLNTGEGAGNFYLKPNGVFLITHAGKALVVPTEGCPAMEEIKWATQSGPMLVVAGKPHPAFAADSQNLRVRNGVGITRQGEVLLVKSRGPVSFHEFAQVFLQLGCDSALCLDGDVSRMSPPEDAAQGEYGAIITVTHR